MQRWQLKVTWFIDARSCWWSASMRSRLASWSLPIILQLLDLSRALGLGSAWLVAAGSTARFAASVVIAVIIIVVVVVVVVVLVVVVLVVVVVVAAAVFALSGSGPSQLGLLPCVIPP